MNKKEIEVLWNNFARSGQGELEYMRVCEKATPSLNIGYNSKLERFFLLELPANYIKNHNHVEKENISLFFLKQEKCLCIILRDNFFNDLFNDFILSVYDKVATVADPKEYTELFIGHFSKWSAFFDNKKTSGLTEEQIKGLFGELVYLKELLNNSELTMQQILSGWRGPYDAGHDFIFDFKDTEVKTIENSCNQVNISSEYQLEYVSGKNLELVVVKVITDTANGINLSEIINEIRTIIFNRSGDNHIFQKALLEKGIIAETLFQYDNQKFIPKEITTYNCDPDFPCITRHNTPEELFEIKYAIRLNLIEKFISATIQL